MDPNLHDLAERVARLEADNAQLRRVLRVVGAVLGDEPLLRSDTAVTSAEAEAQAS